MGFNRLYRVFLYKRTHRSRSCFDVVPALLVIPELLMMWDVGKFPEVDTEDRTLPRGKLGKANLYIPSHPNPETRPVLVSQALKEFC